MTKDLHIYKEGKLVGLIDQFTNSFVFVHTVSLVTMHFRSSIRYDRFVKGRIHLYETAN